RDIGDRAKKLKVTNEAGKKLAEKYKDDLEKATKRMVQAGLQLGKNADAAQIILPALQKIQKAATELQGDLGKKQARDKRCCPTNRRTPISAELRARNSRALAPKQ